MKEYNIGEIATMHKDRVKEISPPVGRRRRCRTQFSLMSLRRLELEFSVDPYPDVHQREALAQELAVTEDRIQVWFQNRRSKQRRLQSQKADTNSSTSIVSFLRSRIRSKNGKVDPQTHDEPVGAVLPVVYPSPFQEALRLYPSENQRSIAYQDDRQTLGKEIKAQIQDGGDGSKQTGFKPRRPWEDTDEPVTPKRQCYSNIHMPYTLICPIPSSFASVPTVFPEQSWHQRESIASSYPMSLDSVYFRGVPHGAPLDLFSLHIHPTGIL